VKMMNRRQTPWGMLALSAAIAFVGPINVHAQAQAGEHAGRWLLSSSFSGGPLGGRKGQARLVCLKPSEMEQGAEQAFISSAPQPDGESAPRIQCKVNAVKSENGSSTFAATCVRADASRNDAPFEARGSARWESGRAQVELLIRVRTPMGITDVRQTISGERQGDC
jgi:hypothetical protein